MMSFGGSPLTAMDLALSLLLYPTLEEYVFRGNLLPWVARAWPVLRPVGANLITSLVFSAAHLPSWPWAHAALVFWPSLLLGWVMQRTGRLEACIGLHALMNAAYLGVTNALASGGRI